MVLAVQSGDAGGIRLEVPNGQAGMVFSSWFHGFQIGQISHICQLSLLDQLYIF